MASKIATLKSTRRLASARGDSLGCAHVALLVASVVAFSTTKPFTPAEDPSPVDMILGKQFNEMTKGEKTAKEKTARAAAARGSHRRNAKRK